MVVGKVSSCNGQDLTEMFNAATRSLERSAQVINLLNVFPVPDGDTGTNMLLTMKAAMEEASRCTENSASAVAQAMAKGSLMGARGNSGVILSQILRGLAHGLDGKESFNGKDLADALIESSTYAYRGVSKPVEGTILTVIRDAAAAAQKQSALRSDGVLSVMEATVTEARASVARTPNLLPVLSQAGVVDAGGQGLYVVFEGALRYLSGDTKETEHAEMAPSVVAATLDPNPEDKSLYGYCTEFMLHGHDLNLETIREKLINMGESVLVVGDDSDIRVHLHTFDPGAVLSYVVALGTLNQVKVENMQEQHEDFIATRTQLLVSDISTVAVASGEGLTQAFYSIGTTIVVPGGKSMNPSVQEILQAVESAPSDKVIILPNNPNVLLSAGQVQNLTKKRVRIVPSKTIPQGISALLALNYENDFETNVDAMNQALPTVLSGEVTTAVRPTELDGLSIKEGQYIAFLDLELVASADTMPDVVRDLLERMDVEQSGLITIYYGASTRNDEVEQLVKSIQEKYPDQEVELVAGGQPHYNYIISVE